MIFDASTTNAEEFRSNVLNKCKANKYKSVVDVGGSLGFWCREVTTHYIDLVPPSTEENSKPYFIADISNPLTWTPVLSYIKEHGKFDYAICTQTLEHTTNISCAIAFLIKIAKKGFIGVPNKYVELSSEVAMGEEGVIRCNLKRKFRGFLPHRWIFTIKTNASGHYVLWAFPKLSFIESLILSWDGHPLNSNELGFEWVDDILIYEVSDVILDAPDPERAIKFYYHHLKEGL